MDFIFNLMPAVVIQTPLIIAFIRYRFSDSLVGTYPVDIDELNQKYPIKDKILLTRSGMIATFVVLLLFLHPFHHQQSGWIALIGAIGIMLLGSNADLHFTLLHVEWDTLLFFCWFICNDRSDGRFRTYSMDWCPNYRHYFSL